MPAPTVAEIANAGHELTIHCPACRLLTLLDPMALADRHDPFKPLDQLAFRCRKCGGPGAPIVKARGNALVGHVQIWPPEEGDSSQLA
ncbi:MAG TPA: hypothetical protein VGH15_13855 [Caulobacteraceae bacterium]